MVVSHVISHVMMAIDLYSASVADLATTLCLLAFQDTRECPKSMQYPDVDLLEIGQLAQPLYQYAVSLAAKFEASRMP